MIFQSAGLRIMSEYGTATLWLDFPGERVNALDLSRLRELDRAFDFIATREFIQILVIRSAKPSGFCAGIHPEALSNLPTHADRAGFSAFGQTVFEQLANLNAVTISLIDGQCHGAGLELALACDYRLVVSRTTTSLGFPQSPTSIRPGFGGRVRLSDRVGNKIANRLLETGELLSGREARDIHLVDAAFCERRANIELRSFLDRLELNGGTKPRRNRELTGFAAERQEFARALSSSQAREAIARDQTECERTGETSNLLNPLPVFPSVVGMIGSDPAITPFLAECAARGIRVVILGDAKMIHSHIDSFCRRGFITPLEASQACARIVATETLAAFERAGLVIVAEDRLPKDLGAVLGKRAIVAISPDAKNANHFPYPRRIIGIRWQGRPELLQYANTDRDSLQTLANWLKLFGYASRSIHHVALLHAA